MPGSIGVTLIACCFALTPLVGVPADLHGTLALSDTSRVSAYPSLTRNADFVDLGTFPRAELAFPGRRWAFSIGYGPQLTLHDVGVAPELLLLHTARAEYSYALRRSRYYLAESVAYGTQNFATLGLLAPGTSAAPQQGTTQPSAMPPSTTQVTAFLPQKSTLRVFSETTSAGFSTDLSRRTTLGSFVSYGISGGRDEDQLFLPQQRTETLGGFLSYAPSRRDTVTTTASASRSVVDPAGFEYWFLSANETWRHVFTPRLSGGIGVGWGQVWTRTDAGWAVSIRPTGIATLSGTIYSYRRRLSVSVSLGVSVSPVINAVTGAIQETLGGSASVVVRHDRTTVTGTVNAAQTVPSDDPGAARFVGAGAVVTHQLSDRVDLFAGYLTAVQVSDSPRLSLPLQWNAFAGISLHAASIRF